MRRSAQTLGTKREQSVLTKVFDFLRGGSRSFNEAERQILQFTLEALPAKDRETLSKQIAAVTLVQRQHPGRLVVAYYKRNPEKVPLLPYPGVEHCIAKVSYKSNGKTRTTALVLHNGKFMSFERNVPQLPTDIESVVKVALHPEGFASIAEDIEAEEHGNPDR